jgi:hypothetical protein
MADESGKIVKLDAGAKTHAPGMTRREAMLELLRVGGVAAGAAAGLSRSRPRRLDAIIAWPRMPSGRR